MLSRHIEGALIPESDIPAFDINDSDIEIHSCREKSLPKYQERKQVNYIQHTPERMNQIIQIRSYRPNLDI